jgi:lipopolysaccharide/colanic/teichoic acid biosynthesis glycosyltransferase
MEPDVLATPADSSARTADWAAHVSPSASALPLEPPGRSNGSVHPMNGIGVSVPLGRNGVDHAATNGHGANGHFANGGLNGHGADAHSTFSPTASRFDARARLSVLPLSGAPALPGGIAHLPIGRDSGLYLRFGKRALDVVGAAVALVLHAPMLLLAAIAIKLESRGPVFYRSTRIGRGGRPFTFYKLRSMVNGADRTRHHLTHLNEADGPVFKISGDPRVTRVGRFLRSTSIDELPQLIHVLTGEMSLVGPRPPLPDEVSQYEPWQLHRLDVRPGLTCLWQISGRSRIGFQEWMRLDLEYIRNQSLALDIKILLRTIPAVLSREGAY